MVRFQIIPVHQRRFESSNLWHYERQILQGVPGDSGGKVDFHDAHSQSRARHKRHGTG